jgi:transcriptional regulator with XRE-family HTH domain
MTSTELLDELQERIRLAAGPLIASRIRRARRQSGMSHDKLGEAIGGVTRQHLIKLEKAQHRPRADMLTRIAEATGKPLDFFLVEEVREPESFSNEAA